MIGCEKDVVNRAAWQKFVQLGLPTRKNEHYRYVRLKGLSFEKREGEFTIENVPEEVMILPLEGAKQMFGALLHNRFEKWLQLEKDPFACLNAALSTEELFFYAPPRSEVAFSILHAGEEGLLLPRLHIHVGKHAEVNLTLDQKGIGTVNRFVDFTLEEGAQVKLHMRAHAERQIDTIRVSLKQNSTFKSVNAMKNTAFQRQDYAVSLLGENSFVELFGVSELDNDNQAHTNVFVEHVAPHATSSQKFKGIVKGRARASFEGKIYVHQKAQQTNAYQMSNYLILDSKASANSKPNLEIFADDVKASHGATIGQIDKEHLFYLQSRGLAKKDAEKLLIQGFVQEIYDKIS